MAHSLFNKVAGLRAATLLKKKLWRRPFPGNFATFLRAPFGRALTTASVYVHLSSKELHYFETIRLFVFLKKLSTMFKNVSPFNSL